MVYGLWFMVYRLSFSSGQGVYGLWFMVLGASGSFSPLPFGGFSFLKGFMVYGLWFMVYGLWFREPLGASRLCRLGVSVF